ncbi:LptF/LptG family permease [Pseudorhizobium banfieldiae]|nr:LptF/LptG family permease [Pseudorhizobium banfieldiae]
MVGRHVWHIQIVLIVLVCIALAVDISPWVGSVWSNAVGRGVIPAVAASFRFSLYRALDITAQVFPIACVLGMLWTEAVHSSTGRRLMIMTTGKSFVRAATPLLIVALAATVIQFSLDNYLRPSAVMKLIEEKLGSYHDYVDRSMPNGSVWLALGSDILRAKIDSADPDILREVELYHFSKTALHAITAAAVAQPAAGGSASSWVLLDGRMWEFGEDTGGSLAAFARRFERQEIELPVDPLWLSYRQLEPKYLPAAVLGALAKSADIPSDQHNYAAWQQLRKAQAFVPGMLGLLAAAVCYVVSARFSLAIAAMASLALGYLGFAAMRLMTVIAEHAILPSHIAAWALPTILLICCAAAFWQLAKPDRAFPRKILNKIKPQPALP